MNPLFFEPIDELWENHKKNKFDATLYDQIIDGCGFEILSLKSTNSLFKNGEDRHRSELCSLYIRENLSCSKPLNQKSKKL